MRKNIKSCYSGLYDNPLPNDNPFPDIDLEATVANQRLMQKYKDVSPNILKEKLEKSARINRSLNKKMPPQQQNRNAKEPRIKAKDLSLSEAWISRPKYPAILDSLISKKISKMSETKKLEAIKKKKVTNLNLKVVKTRKARSLRSKLRRHGKKNNSTN